MYILYMVIITIGISGSGKTRWRNEYLRDISFPETWKVVSHDDIRLSLGDISDQSKNNIVWTIAYAKLEAYIDCEQNVIFDSTACNVNTLQQIIATCHNTQVLYKIFDADVELSYARIQQDLAKGVV